MSATLNMPINRQVYGIGNGRNQTQETHKQLIDLYLMS